MDELSYHRHRYPSIVIQQAIWLYFPTVTLSGNLQAK
jgi:hypothetical protein